MVNMSTDTIKRCPFCGGEAKMEEYFKQWDGRYYEVAHISCRLCGCSSNTISEMECKDRKKRKEEAIKAWNTRTPIERILKRLEENCFWTSSTYDEDGYCNDDSEEVVDLYKAIEIVKEEGGIE